MIGRIDDLLGDALTGTEFALLQELRRQSDQIADKKRTARLEREKALKKLEVELAREMECNE